MAKLYFYYSAMNAGKSTTLLQACSSFMCLKQRGTELGNPRLSALPALSLHGLLNQPVISPKWRCWQPGFVEQIAVRIGGSADQAYCSGILLRLQSYRRPARATEIIDRAANSPLKEVWVVLRETCVAEYAFLSDLCVYVVSDCKEL